MILANFLSEQGLSQESFGATIGVRGATVSRWLSGKRCPSGANVRKIKEATKGRVTADDLLCSEGA